MDSQLFKFRVATHDQFPFNHTRQVNPKTKKIVQNAPMKTNYFKINQHPLPSSMTQVPPKSKASNLTLFSSYIINNY